MTASPKLSLEWTGVSSQWIAEAVAGGLLAVGVQVQFAGVITTPGVAWLTKMDISVLA